MDSPLKVLYMSKRLLTTELSESPSPAAGSMSRVNNTFATEIFGGFRWADFVVTDGHQALPCPGMAWRSQGVTLKVLVRHRSD